MITIEATPIFTEVTAQISETNIEVSISPANTTVVEVSTAFPPLSANSITVVPYKTITSTSLQTALEQLADQNFRSGLEPTGSNLAVGDTWYDTSNDVFYIYRTVNGVTDWYPLINGGADTPDQLDGGAF